jgi:hypothetical protein
VTTVPGVARVRAYHDSTKHHVGRFARSSGYLDWATQPDPFRRFAGAALVDLVGPLDRALAARGRAVVRRRLPRARRPA